MKIKYFSKSLLCLVLFIASVSTTKATVLTVIGLASDIQQLASGFFDSTSKQLDRIEKTQLNSILGAISGTMLTLENASDYNDSLKSVAYRESLIHLNQSIETSKLVLVDLIDSDNLPSSFRLNTMYIKLGQLKVELLEYLGESSMASMQKKINEYETENHDRELESLKAKAIEECIEITNNSQGATGSGLFLASGCSLGGPVGCVVGLGGEALNYLFSASTTDSEKENCRISVNKVIEHSVGNR